MKSTISILFVLFTLTAGAQEYVMFSTVTLDPTPSKINELRAGLAEHQSKYHKNGTPYQASILRINSGPNSGKIVWLEGPQTFSDYDHYDDLGEGHGEHWGMNIEAHCNSMGHTEYWKEWTEHTRTGSTPQPIVMVKYLDVNTKERQGYRMAGLFKKLSTAIKAMDGDFSWSINSNEFQQGSHGRHFAIVSDYASFSDLDKNINQFGQRKVRAAFDKIYGEGSHATFVNEWNEVFSDSYDEILTVMDF